VRALLANTKRSEAAISCDPGGRTGSSKNRKAGAISSKEKSPLSFLMSLLRYSWVALRMRRAHRKSGAVMGIFTEIKRSAMVLGVVCLFFAADVSGQSTGHLSNSVFSSQYANDGTVQAAPQGPASGVEILSDTQGVNFGPYIRQSLQTIKNEWITLLPEEARPPVNLQGETVIRFTVSPDGKISEMHLDAISHQKKLDLAAWGSIVSVGQLPPLPADFSGPNLQVRIHFKVNLPKQ
jgi:TonB family protein